MSENEKTFEEMLELSSLNDIKATGISIRVGGQIVKFVASEEKDITVEEEIRNDFRQQYREEVAKLKDRYESLHTAANKQIREKNQELKNRERELKKKEKETVVLPPISFEHIKKGLSVAVNPDSYSGGYAWSYICVYAPKQVNNKPIEPTFAKKLMTPIRIFVYTDTSWKITEVRLVKLINCDKFEHYHSMGSGRDCWGNNRYSGIIVDTPEKALEFVKEIQMVMETINRLSIGSRAPRGLPRLATLEKHLLAELTTETTSTRSTTSRQNERAGFDENVNADVTASMWSTI